MTTLFCSPECTAKLIILFCIIIVLIILLIYRIHIENKHINEFLEGVWLSSEEFNKKAEIDNMVLYIGPPSEIRNIYLIMYKDDIVIDKKMKIKISLDYNFYLTTKFDGKIKLIDEDITDIMPDKQNCIIDIINGSMIWKKNDTTYGEFLKDNHGTKIGKNF